MCLVNLLFVGEEHNFLLVGRIECLMQVIAVLKFLIGRTAQRLRRNFLKIALV